jgi:glycosyltransferase involved in cell wall biosynthesis
MNVAFIISHFQEDIPKNLYNDYIWMAESLRANNVESIFYTPVRKKGVATIRREGKNQTMSIFISCWVPFFSKYRKTLVSKPMEFRRIFDFLELFIYLIRIRRRLHYDHVDAYVIIHLWDSTIALLSPILSRFRPVAVLWMGFSLHWLARFKWLYPFLVPLYKLVLRKTTILTPLDIEQEIGLFKILKLQDVYMFNPCIVDEKTFHELDKDQCAKSVGFDTTKINILSMCRIIDPKKIESDKASDFTKNIFKAVEIFRWLSKENSKVHFHITGEGDGMDKLKSKISSYGLKDRITVHGWIENEARPLFVNAADLIINPYPLIEFNDATTIFEAFMCGKPVVAFKRYSWVRSEHKGGFLVDKDPRVGAKQIGSRLDPVYLARKSEEAKLIPNEHNVPKRLWGKRLSEILTEISRR